LPEVADSLEGVLKSLVVKASELGEDLSTSRRIANNFLT
jgi:hypothetical protein